MIGSFWSLVPFLIVIPISMWTKQVIPGLAIGLMVGAYMLHPTPMGGLMATVHYLIRELTIPDNVRLVLFLYGFGALVGLVRVTGGIAGFSRWLEHRVTTVRRAFLITWISSIGTFMAPDFRIITVAPIMKAVFSRLNVPRKKAAIVIDITSTPLTSVIPIGTAFVGYMVGLLAVSNRHHASGSTAFQLFLRSIPWNLFAWAALAVGLIYTFWPNRQKSEHPVAANVAQSRERPGLGTNPGRLRPQFSVEAGADLSTSHEPFPDAVELASESAPPKAIHLLLPIGMLLILTLFFTWWSGHTKTSGLFAALAHADAATAMLEALLVTLVVSMLFYAVRRQSLSRTMFGFLAGGNDMMGVIVLLALVWGVTAVSADLGFASFTQREVSRLVPPAFVAPVLFVCGCLISYVIGSSFGTWAMLLPLGFSLANSTHASIPLVVGAVFASGTFGGFASPLSDNTVAMATVMKLPVMEYARSKLKLALPAAGLCAGAYAVVGWLA